MIDAVLSYHTNPATCGVAKWNRQLAARLGVPFGDFGTVARHGLYSLKTSECREWFYQLPYATPFSLFFHDVPNRPERPELQRAVVVYAADAVIAAAIRLYRSDVITAWCPSTIQGNPHRAPLNILTFGMAHKLRLEYYRKLHALLGERDYTLSVSTAVHEGSPWDAVATVGDQLREIFGDKTRVLGFLADDALARELQQCAAVALFFDPALRANNTTFHAVVAANRPIITNLDADSPEGAADVADDIETMTEWRPRVTDPRAFLARYSWEALLQTMRATTSA